MFLPNTKGFGAKLFLAARNTTKGDASAAAIKEKYPEAQVTDVIAVPSLVARPKPNSKDPALQLISVTHKQRSMIVLRINSDFSTQ